MGLPDHQLDDLHKYIDKFESIDNINDLFEALDDHHVEKLLHSTDKSYINAIIEDVFEQHKAAKYSIPIFSEEDIQNVRSLGVNSQFQQEVNTIIASLGLHKIDMDHGDSNNKLIAKPDSNRNSNKFNTTNILTTNKNEPQNTQELFRSKASPNHFNLEVFDHALQDMPQPYVPNLTGVVDKPSGSRSKSLNMPNTLETKAGLPHRQTSYIINRSSSVSSPATINTTNVNVTTKSETIPTKNFKQPSLVQKFNIIKTKLAETSDSKLNTAGGVTSVSKRRSSMVKENLPLYIRNQLQKSPKEEAGSSMQNSRIKNILSNSNSLYASKNGSRECSQESTSDYVSERNLSDEDKEYISPTSVSRFIDYEENDLEDIDFVNLSEEEEEEEEEGNDDDEDDYLFK